MKRIFIVSIFLSMALFSEVNDETKIENLRWSLASGILGSGGVIANEIRFNEGMNYYTKSNIVYMGKNCSIRANFNGAIVRKGNQFGIEFVRFHETDGRLRIVAVRNPFSPQLKIICKYDPLEVRDGTVGDIENDLDNVITFL